VRGQKEDQSQLFSYVSAEQRVPANHPIRRVKSLADEALADLSSVFDAMYSHLGRPSIPPERLLKSCLLIALYSVRSDRLFCEMLDYNILYRWFLDMSMDEPSFDASTFSKNRDRLLDHDVAQKFFDAVVRLARQEGLLSDDHFTVDGTLIEAYASLKSFKKKPGQKDEPPKKDKEPPPDDPGNPTVNFHGEKRSNKTHESTTDPESRLLKKGPGKEAKLTFCGHAFMENRNGLLVDFRVTQSVGTTETEAAREILKRQARKRVRPTTLGGDKNYHVGEFVSDLRNRGIKPHIAMRDDRVTPGLDGRTTRHIGYGISQRIRKRIEEAFGWMKTVGGLRKSRFRGVARNQLAGHLVGAAYNLLRMANLCPAPG
jgi:transposase